ARRAPGLFVVCVATYDYDGICVQIRGYVGTSDPVNRWDPSGLDWEWSGSAWERVPDTNPYVPKPLFRPEQVGGVSYIDASAYTAIRDAFIRSAFGDQASASQDGLVYGGSVGLASRPGSVIGIHNLVRPTTSFLGPFTLPEEGIGLHDPEVRKSAIAYGIGPGQVQRSLVLGDGTTTTYAASDFNDPSFLAAVSAYDSSANFEAGLDRALDHIDFDQALIAASQAARIGTVQDIVVGNAANAAGFALDLLLLGPSGEGAFLSAAIRDVVAPAIRTGVGSGAARLGSFAGRVASGARTSIDYARVVWHGAKGGFSNVFEYAVKMQPYMGRLSASQFERAYPIVAGLSRVLGTERSAAAVAKTVGADLADIGSYTAARYLGRGGYAASPGELIRRAAMAGGALRNGIGTTRLGSYSAAGQIIAGTGRAYGYWSVGSGGTGFAMGYIGPPSEFAVPTVNPIALPFELGLVLGGVLSGLD
ncbi:MAG: hypothetical protein PF961_13650, partial [Planctomycetota bacterium]|nr:hypothetical protein [Planctomycetota bacterium]